MSKYTIELDDAADKSLLEQSAAHGIAPETLIAQILHLWLPAPHRMNEESLKKGYEACAEIYLNWANLYGKE